MTTVTDVCTALKTILLAVTDVDTGSIDDFSPAISTQKITLLIVPFEQSGVMAFSRVGPYSVVHAHRIPCEFWIKVNTGDIAAAMQRGRDTRRSACRLIAANPTLGIAGAQVGSSLLGALGRIGEYSILPRIEEKGQIHYVIARLFVPVEIDELTAL